MAAWGLCRNGFLSTPRLHGCCDLLVLSATGTARGQASWAVFAISMFRDDVSGGEILSWVNCKIQEIKIIISEVNKIRLSVICCPTVLSFRWLIQQTSRYHWSGYFLSYIRLQNIYFNRKKNFKLIEVSCHFLTKVYQSKVIQFGDSEHLIKPPVHTK